MMKRNLILTICFALIFCALAGCQLAKESTGSSASGDKLIGVFVTTQYLDLFDFDGYMIDNIKNFQGGEITMDNKTTQKYQGRIYATLVPSTYTSEETGETILTHDYTFTDIEGIQFCIPIVQSTEDENSYRSTMTDPALSNVNTSIAVGDDENSITLDGTIFVTTSGNIDKYYFNPVYQSADGSVYVVSGESFSFNNETNSEGAVFSQNLSETTTITENGKTKKDSISINISISSMFAPEKIVVIQMNADNAPVSQTEYKPDTLPDDIALEAVTAYVIVETYKQDGNGTATVSRDIYGRDAKNIETYFARADGFCVKRNIKVVA